MFKIHNKKSILKIKCFITSKDHSKRLKSKLYSHKRNSNNFQHFRVHNCRFICNKVPRRDN